MLKSRDITWPAKVRLVKVLVFAIVMYECESWTVKKAEHWGIDAFEPWYWRRLLRVPWTARRSNQSILKEISPGCSLEGLLLKLKLQYFGLLMWRIDSFEKTLILGDWRQEKGMTEDEMVGWHHQLNGHEFEQTLGVGDEQGSLACCSPLGYKASMQLSDWSELNWTEVVAPGNMRFSSLVDAGGTSFCYCSVANLCPTLFDPMDCSRPVLPVLYSLLDFSQIHVHWVVNAI